ncbi:MAG TPA: formate/nitrite transporter family protein [Dehalococcoidia bacterium]|nr:formate/nitrite transporter family protein [Dehalococcoidia bacterium]
MQDHPASFDLLLPPAMAERAEEVGVAKANMPLHRMFVLAVLAGAFIALGANFFTVVVTESSLGFGPSRLLGGLAFSLGLILVVIGGAELFTGNNLMVMAFAAGKVQAVRLLAVWAVVYAGNFAGAVATAVLVLLSGQWRLGGEEVGATAVRIASAKVDLDFEGAFFLGVLCNALVCLAVWLTYSARSTIDKAVAIVFPISAFVAAGFEHSIANMYFIPLGILLENRVGAASSADLGWVAFASDNLLPVTLGNMVGGGVLVGLVYWFAYLWHRQGK